MSYYRRHLMFCTNQRDSGHACGHHGASGMVILAKKHLAERVATNVDRLRISRTGCLGRCDLGPVAVVYPEGVWYTYVDSSDVLEIVDQHLAHGCSVQRLNVDDTCEAHPIAAGST
jgi:(2Fe-2S) ferredoxin